MTTMATRPGGPCAAGIIFAIPIEADAFTRLATKRSEVEASGLVFREGIIRGHRVAWCVGGIGCGRANRAARLLIDGHRPTALISAGFAGGLDPAFPRGTIVQPSAVRGRSDVTPRKLQGQGGPLLVTVDAIVHTAAEKQSLRATTGAALVDMETLAVADVALREGLPCHGVRVVSDAVGDELPPDLGQLAGPHSVARKAGALVGLLSRRPRAAMELWKLWERAVVDGRALAAALAEVIGHLPPPSGPTFPSADQA